MSGRELRVGHQHGHGVALWAAATDTRLLRHGRMAWNRCPQIAARLGAMDQLLRLDERWVYRVPSTGVHGSTPDTSSLVALVLILAMPLG